MVAQPSADPHHTRAIDPFEKRRKFVPRVLHAVLATALFRCWHLILFSTTWSLAVCLIIKHVHDVSIKPTVLTVLGTVLGFVISYRTSSSFERYNEGRKLWASVILASRTFARFVWFHVPDTWAAGEGATLDPIEQKARTLVEKKTTINLVEAFGVAVKHYLRGEDGINYEDLYHLVKFLPAYALPAGMPMNNEDVCSQDEDQQDSQGKPEDQDLEAQVPSLSRRKGASTANTLINEKQSANQPVLLPARNPPKYSIFDVFPFSLLVSLLTKRGKNISGKKAAKARRTKDRIVSHNVPLEITLYLSSYISSLQTRKHADAPTTNALINSLNMLTDSLTGLERVLTTPIPWSYSVHLWTVTTVYVLALPFQMWDTLEWITIPATFIASFFFFGFLVAGEEIENPFGYDKNDLNLDHFTHSIIRLELQSLTSRPMPDVSQWAFVANNDHLFGSESQHSGVQPEEWVRRGTAGMQTVMADKDAAGNGVAGGSGHGRRGSGVEQE